MPQKNHDTTVTYEPVKAYLHDPDTLTYMGLQIEISTSNEWHVLKGTSQYGPYTYEQMIKMLQEKTLFSFDYVWSPHMATWTQVAELGEYSADRIARLAQIEENSKVFSNRSHERAACDWEVYVHNDQKFWTGKIESVSEGGALVLMENPLLLPGDTLTLHVTKSKENPVAFNAKCEVLSKRLTRERVEHDSQIYYAVKFSQIQPVGAKSIQAYVDEKLNPAKEKKSNKKGEKK